MAVSLRIFYVQLFLLPCRPSSLKLINSIVFLSLIWLVLHRASWREHNALGLLAIFGCIWVLQPEFGQVFLWLTGAINHLWCGVLCLVFMLPYSISSCMTVSRQSPRACCSSSSPPSSARIRKIPPSP